jgi:hypothetical protein
MDIARCEHSAAIPGCHRALSQTRDAFAIAQRYQ